jgi:hypothetical protein
MITSAELKEQNAKAKLPSLSPFVAKGKIQ